MKFDVSLAGWILAVITFSVGTIAPGIYGKFAFDSVSIKQPHDMGEFCQSEKQKNRSEIIYSTIIKFANASNSSVLIDEIKINPPNIKNKITFSLQEIRFAKFTGKQHYFHVPWTHEEGVALDYLPFIVKSSAERVLVIEFKITYLADKPDSALDDLNEYARKKGLLVDIRLKGKYGII